MPTPGTVTLAQLRTLAQQESDMVNSSFISTAEWNTYISNSYKELYDLLIGAYGNDYFVQSPYQFTTDGVNALFALPSDFYKLLGVDLSLSGTPTGFVTLPKFNFSERNRFAAPNVQSFYGVTNLRYRLNGAKLWLTPQPSAGQIIQVWYIPAPASLSLDTDTIDGISGWEEYVVIDAAIKALAKEESDVSVLGARKAAILRRIEAMAEDRDAGSPATVSDVMSGRMDDEYDWGIQ